MGICAGSQNRGTGFSTVMLISAWKDADNAALRRGETESQNFTFDMQISHGLPGLRTTRHSGGACV